MVLSTDGLTDTVRKEEIHQQMYTTSSSLEQKADSLVKLAEDKESKDNISLVILDLKRGDMN